MRSVVAALGALVYGLFASGALWLAIYELQALVRFTSAGSGGGAISVGIGDLVVYGLPGIASIVVSRMLAGWAGRSDRRMWMLHRAQKWSIAVAFAVTAIVPVLTIRGAPVLFALFPFNGLAWGALFALTATLLGAYAVRRPGTSPEV